MATYRIENSNGKTGGVWTREFATKEDAVGAISKSYGWIESGVCSESFPDLDREGIERKAWCVYENQSDCDRDGDGAHAPRVIEIR